MRNNFEKCHKQITFAPKSKSSTISSCPILQGRKAAKADGCSGAIEGACSYFFISNLTETQVVKCRFFLNTEIERGLIS
jgi:hypothetical protein